MKDYLKENAGLISLFTGLISYFVIFAKAQFGLNIVPEFNDFAAVLVLSCFVIWGLINKKKVKK